MSPKAESRCVNAVEKICRYCIYCKKTGHAKETCWSLNGKKDKFSRKGKNNYVAKDKKIKRSSIKQKVEVTKAKPSSDEETDKKKKAITIVEIHSAESRKKQTGLAP